MTIDETLDELRRLLAMCYPHNERVAWLQEQAARWSAAEGTLDRRAVLMLLRDHIRGGMGSLPDVELPNAELNAVYVNILRQFSADVADALRNWSFVESTTSR